MNKFEKVSYEQFKKDAIPFINMSNISTGVNQEDLIKHVYNCISLPKRATKGSAGYDFYAPMDINLHVREYIVVPTGIRVRVDEGWFLSIVPKSGLGFRYGTSLANTMGIIDSDYYYSDNEGHIMVKLTISDKMESCKTVIPMFKSFVQGIFLPYGITVDDNAHSIRNGGLGSTDK